MFEESLATGSTFVVAGGTQLQENILESQPDTELNGKVEEQNENNNIGYDLSSNPCRRHATTPPMAVVSKKVSNNLASVIRDMLDKMPRNPTKRWWDRLMEIEGILIGKMFRATEKMNSDLKRSQCADMTRDVRKD